MQAAAALMQNSLMVSTLLHRGAGECQTKPAICLIALQVAIILLAGINLAGWKLHRPLRESIMVITGLAVVLETHTVCGMGSSAVLDAALIQDVILNEVIKSRLLSVGHQLPARHEQCVELIGRLESKDSPCAQHQPPASVSAYAC